MTPRPIPDECAPGQESVWEYPRPPALRRCLLPISVVLGGEVICETGESWQVLETSHPPTYYLPKAEFRSGTLVPVPGTTFCEFKGHAE